MYKEGQKVLYEMGGEWTWGTIVCHSSEFGGSSYGVHSIKYGLHDCGGVELDMGHTTTDGLSIWVSGDCHDIIPMDYLPNDKVTVCYRDGGKEKEVVTVGYVINAGYSKKPDSDGGFDEYRYYNIVVKGLTTGWAGVNCAEVKVGGFSSKLNTIYVIHVTAPNGLSGWTYDSNDTVEITFVEPYNGKHTNDEFDKREGDYICLKTLLMYPFENCSGMPQEIADKGEIVKFEWCKNSKNKKNKGDTIYNVAKGGKPITAVYGNTIDVLLDGGTVLKIVE